MEYDPSDDYYWWQALVERTSQHVHSEFRNLMAMTEEYNDRHHELEPHQGFYLFRSWVGDYLDGVYEAECHTRYGTSISYDVSVTRNGDMCQIVVRLTSKTPSGVRMSPLLCAERIIPFPPQILGEEKFDWITEGF